MGEVRDIRPELEPAGPKREGEELLENGRVGQTYVYRLFTRPDLPSPDGVPCVGWELWDGRYGYVMACGVAHGGSVEAAKRIAKRCSQGVGRTLSLTGSDEAGGFVG